MIVFLHKFNFSFSFLSTSFLALFLDLSYHVVVLYLTSLLLFIQQILNTFHSFNSLTFHNSNA
eukprot:UN18881